MTRSMLEADTIDRTVAHPARFENRESMGRVILVCEHASAEIPPAFGDLGLGPQARFAHIAWDPGALDLARSLSRRMDACLIHAPLSRLIYDLNRAPDQPGAMPARSEVFDIPGNAAISAEERNRRTQSVYVPFHNDLSAEISRRMALGLNPVIITIHSFTPIWHGAPREVEFGVIHDSDPSLAKAIVAMSVPSGLRTALNAPYSASDGVTHTLRLHASPYGLPNAMLEVRNDLIASLDMADDVASRLAPLLSGAIASAAGGR